MRVSISILISVVLLLSGGWLYWQSLGNFSSFHEIEGRIKQLYRERTHFNIILAATQREFYPDYDELQKAWLSLKVAFSELHAELEKGHPGNPSFFTTQMEETNRLFYEREELLIDFLEANSVLHNSEAYLLTMIQEFDEGVVNIDADVRSELIQFIVVNDFEAGSLLEELEQAQAAAKNGISGQLLNSMYRHIEVILKFRRLLVDIDNKLVQMGLMMVFDDISSANHQYYRDVQQQSRTYQLSAYLVTILFFIMLMISIYQLRKSYQDLVVGNKALAQSEEKLAGILDLVSGGLISMDENYNIIMFNRRAEEIFGYRREEMLGQNLEILIPEIYRDQHRQHVQYFSHSDRNILPRMARSTDVFGLRKDGNVFQMEIGISKSKAEEGRIFTAFTEDISEQKEREGELIRLRGLLSNVINSMPSMLVGVNINGQVNLWNKSAQKETGITEDNAMGCSIFDVYPLLQVEMRDIQAAIREGRPLTMQKVKLTKNDADCFRDITVYPLVVDGKSGAVIRIDDITEKVRIQELIVQSEKMLSVGGLAAGMAHEINNPLAGILQNMQVIGNRISKKLPKNELAADECGTSLENIECYLEKRGILKMMGAIVDSGQRAANIISNMLAFSRKGSGQKTSCNVTEILDSTLDLITHDFSLNDQYDFKHITIEKDYRVKNLVVLCERDQIQQVILNILSNGAHVLLRNKHGNTSARITLRVDADSDWVRIEIEDNGPGMDETIRKRIFEPFFTTKKEGDGIGLGLSVSFFIISEIHHGSLSVESAPGKGSKFIIQLPVHSDG